MMNQKNIFAHSKGLQFHFHFHIRIQSVDGKPKSPGQPVGAGGCESHPLPLVGEWKIIPHDSLSSKTCILLGVYTDGWFIPLLVFFWAWWPTRRTCPLPWSPVSFRWLATGFLAGLETSWMCSGNLSASSMWPTNFLFSVFATMLGISVTFTGLEPPHLTRLAALVRQMAGMVSKDYHDGVTHIVAAKVKCCLYCFYTVFMEIHRQTFSTTKNKGMGMDSVSSCAICNLLWRFLS